MTKRAISMPGYARRRGVLGDIDSIYANIVQGITHRTRRPFCWSLGKGEVELIEFGSFNPKNANYVPGGKVMEVR